MPSLIQGERGIIPPPSIFRCQWEVLPLYPPSMYSTVRSLWLPGAVGGAGEESHWMSRVHHQCLIIYNIGFTYIKSHISMMDT